MTVIYGLCSTMGPFTGACFNPCLGLVLPSFYAVVADKGAQLYVDFIPVYILAPLLGGIFAALFTKYVAFNIHEEELRKKELNSSLITPYEKSLMAPYEHYLKASFDKYNMTPYGQSYETP